MSGGPAAKGPRLWLEPARVRPDGSLAPARWCIRDDGRYKHRTRFGIAERGGAEEALRQHIAKKHQISAEQLDPGQRLTADILKLYAQDVAANHARPAESASRIARLILWWGQPAFAMRDMRERTGAARRMTGHLTDIDSATCKAYVAHVGAKRSAAMDLSMLRAAMNHAVEERKLTSAMKVTLPEPAEPRERWLSRKEAAALLWAAWRHRRSGNGRSGEPDEWGTRKHIARFILASLYTGTRKTAALLGAFDRVPGFGYIDLDEGLWYRQPSGKKRTKKRQPPVPIPAPLLSHMRRWRRNGQRFVVEFNGQPVQRVDKAFRQLVTELNLDDVVIHTLRHTAITWGLQNGMEPYDASGFFGVSLEVLMKVYGHHCPSHLREAAQRMVRQREHGVAATRTTGTK